MTRLRELRKPRQVQQPLSQSEDSNLSYLNSPDFDLWRSNIEINNSLPFQSHMSGMFVPPVHLATAGSLSGMQASEASKRGELAVRQARLDYTAGKELHGEGSWETQGNNRGPMLTPMNQSNFASGQEGYEWCGIYVGHAHAKAGIRPEILKKNVFWSGYRLHLFFTQGLDVNQRKVGSFWQPHQNLSLHGLRGEARKAALDAYKPRPGDVALFRSDYSHVGIVDSYNPQTGELMILEGNSGNRVRATTYGTADSKITFIGRFNSSDYGPAVNEDLYKSGTPDIEHNDTKSSRTR